MVFCSGFADWEGIFEAAQGVSKVPLNGFSFVAVICFFDMIFDYVGNVFVLFLAQRNLGRPRGLERVAIAIGRTLKVCLLWHI